MKQTKITDYFHSEKSANTKKINNKLEKLRNECLRIKGQCRTNKYDSTMFLGDMGILTEYVLALGEKINSMK
jgi:hypothetical protein